MLEANISVRTINGVYQEAQVTVILSGSNRYELRVQNTHPMMLDLDVDGGHQAVTLVGWKNSRGYLVEIPQQLHQKIIEMRSAATLSNEEALAKRTALIASIETAYQELGINPTQRPRM